MSSLLTAQTISTISQQYTLYVSFIILFSGLFGHAANIFVLTRLKIFRNNPSAFYLIAESVVNLLQMAVPFTSRIAINGFAYDLTQTSLLWCKLRQVIAQAFTLISLSIVCFASIDQFLSTSHRPYLRQISTVVLAQVLLSSTTILWILHGIPIGLFFEIQSTSGCNIYNSHAIAYVTYVYYLILTSTLPITVSSMFSLLAYRNVRHIIRRQMPVRRRKLDQQLTAMVLVRVTFLFFTTLPYVLHKIYTFTVTIDKNDVIQKAIVQLLGSITISLFYLNYSVC